MTDVVFSIIPEDFEDLKYKAGRVKNILDFIQIDISNNTFTPSFTWPFQDGSYFYQNIVSGEEGLPFWEDVQYEVDMLIDNPEKEIEDWINAGVSKIIIHLETTEEIEKIREITKEAGVELGISINPSTEDKVLYDNLKHADFVQFMGSDEIGFHGVELDENVFNKIQALREKAPEIIISIDIGVNESTAKELVEAGANRLVSGSFILDSESPKSSVEFLKNL